MTSKRGEIPNYIIYFILGLIILVTVSIFFIGRPIPRTYQDFQTLEKELRQEWDTFRNGSRIQTVEDATFLKTYAAFIESFNACMRSSLTACHCALSLPENFPQNYHIYLAYDSQIGYYSYAFALRDGKKLLLKDRDLLFQNAQVSPRGYIFRTDAWHVYATHQVDIFSPQPGQLQLATPPKDVPAILKTPKLFGSEEQHLYTYNLEHEVILFQKTINKEITFFPSYAYAPGLFGNLLNMPACVEPTS